MGRYDLVAIKTDPDHGYLGTAVWVQGHQVSQGRGVEHSSGAVGQRRRHEITLAVQAAKARPCEAVRSSRKAMKNRIKRPVLSAYRSLRHRVDRHQL
jgi:hypothetical protein